MTEKNLWASEAHVCETIDLTIQKNAAALGRVQQLNTLLEFNYEELAAGLNYKIQENEDNAE